jgi:hypothetical protein
MPRKLPAAYPGGDVLCNELGRLALAAFFFPRRYSRPCRGTHAQAQPLLTEGINAKSTQEGTTAGALEAASTTTCCVLPMPAQTLPVHERVNPEWRLVKVYISRPQQLTDQRWAFCCFRWNEGSSVPYGPLIPP